jgi:hypothetical protein
MEDAIKSCIGLCFSSCAAGYQKKIDTTNTNASRSDLISHCDKKIELKLKACLVVGSDDRILILRTLTAYLILITSYKDDTKYSRH